MISPTPSAAHKANVAEWYASAWKCRPVGGPARARWITAILPRGFLLDTGSFEVINTTQVGQNLETRMEPTSDAAAPSDNPPAVLLKASQAHRPGPIRNQGKKRKADRSTTASSDALTVVDKKAAQKTKKKRVSRKPKVQETDRPAMTFAHELGARGVALLEQFDQVDALYCVLVVSVHVKSWLRNGSPLGTSKSRLYFIFYKRFQSAARLILPSLFIY